MKTKKCAFDVKMGGDGELDEVFVKNAFVHIERMDETAFWIGISTPDGQNLMLNTGVYRGKWFFRIEEDKMHGGFSHTIERPRRR